MQNSNGLFFFAYDPFVMFIAIFSLVLIFFGMFVLPWIELSKTNNFLPAEEPKKSLADRKAALKASNDKVRAATFKRDSVRLEQKKRMDEVLEEFKKARERNSAQLQAEKAAKRKADRAEWERNHPTPPPES